MGMKDVTVEQVNQVGTNNMMAHLGIVVTEIGDDYLKATMPVDHRTHQPMGLLHGGASVALIETLGSVGSSLLIDLNVEYPVGLEVNANHVGAIKAGNVVAHAQIVHKGKRTHVWQVDVRSEDGDRLICTGRLTVMIVKNNK